MATQKLQAKKSTSKKHAANYPNALAKWIKIRRCKSVQRIADETRIPLRTLWEYVGERALIEQERLEQLAAYFHCQPEQLLSKAPSYWNVPFQRNPIFTGREDILFNLHETLFQSKAVGVTQQALSGLGGIGKTQTVLEYAYQFCDEYQAVFWVKSDSRESILSDFLAIAELLQLSERKAQNQSVTIGAVHRWLRGEDGWLLIFDNADDLTLVRDILPTGYRGHVLLTTRAQSMGRVAQRLDIDTMDRDVGSLLLLRRAGMLGPTIALSEASVRDRRAASEIVKVLGGLPLALDQAGAYIEETGRDLESYLSLYHEQQMVLLKRRGGIAIDHPEPVATTWSLSFRNVQSESSIASALLSLCAFLDPDAIPEELIVEGVTSFESDLLSIAGNKFLLDQAVETLRKFSLLRRTENTHMFSLHRLVQAAIQEPMSEDVQRLWADRAVRCVKCVFPSHITPANWEICQRLLPQAQKCALLIEQWQVFSPEAASTLNQCAYYLRERARYAESEALYLKALEIRERVLGTEDVETACSCYNLGRLYFDLGRYAESEYFHQRALSIREHIQGEKSVDVAGSLNSLALLYWAWENKLDEAETLYTRALSIFEETVGVEHALTAHCLNNLGLLLVMQKRYGEAERIYRQVLTIREKILNPLHLDIAQSVQNLGRLIYEHRDDTRYAEAEQLFKRSLFIREQLLGQDHPQIARSLNNLALLYEEQERYIEAEPLYLRAFMIREKILGQDNQKTQVTREAYSSILRKLGRGEETRLFLSATIAKSI